jgi:hypothetical protein
MKYVGKVMNDRYEQFKTFDHEFFQGSRSNTELNVRRVNQQGRDETQVSVSIFTHYQKSNRLNRVVDSFELAPRDALLLAFALAPELKTMIGDLIFGTDNDLIQPMIDRCNKIVDVVGRETFDGAKEIR